MVSAGAKLLVGASTARLVLILAQGSTLRTGCVPGVRTSSSALCAPDLTDTCVARTWFAEPAAALASCFGRLAGPVSISSFCNTTRAELSISCSTIRVFSDESDQGRYPPLPQLQIWFQTQNFLLWWILGLPLRTNFAEQTRTRHTFHVMILRFSLLGHFSKMLRKSRVSPANRNCHFPGETSFCFGAYKIRGTL